ncbi:MAG: radical SAM/SPASM domain-containing protein [Candidatus Aenigmatarchaeota archaeon]
MNEHERSKIRRILGWLEGEEPGPWKIDVELHRRCNLRCLSCSRRSADNYEEINEHSKEIEMSTEKWLEIIDEAAELGVEEWHIAGGGEPLLLPERTLRVMERIKEHGMYGILTDNGTQFDEEMIKRVIEMGWDVIHFSIDGPDAETHDYLRQVNEAFRKATRSVKNFQRFKNKLSSDKPEIRVNTVLSKENYNKLPQMAEYLNEMDVSYWFVEPLIVYSETGEKLKLGKEEMEEFRKEYYPKLIEKCRKYGIGNNFDSVKGNLEEELIGGTNKMDEIVKEDAEERENVLSVPCYQPFFHMVIKCNGNVNFCDVFTDTGVNVKDKSLKEVWHGDYMEEVRQEMLKKKIPDYCGKCNPSNTTQRRRYREEMKNMLSQSKLERIKRKVSG